MKNEIKEKLKEMVCSWLLSGKITNFPWVVVMTSEQKEKLKEMVNLLAEKEREFAYCRNGYDDAGQKLWKERDKAREDVANFIEAL